jgi:hypothetical protein
MVLLLLLLVAGDENDDHCYDDADVGEMRTSGDHDEDYDTVGWSEQVWIEIWMRRVILFE